MPMTSPAAIDNPSSRERESRSRLLLLPHLPRLITRSAASGDERTRSLARGFLRLVPLRTGHAVAIFTYRGRCIFICMQGGRGSGKGWGEGAFAVGRVRGKAASRKRPTTRRSGRPPARMHATSCYSAFPRPRGEEAGRGGGRGEGRQAGDATPEL